MPTRAESIVKAINGIEDPEEKRQQQTLIMAEEAIGRITLLNTREPENTELFVYQDGSYIIVSWPHLTLSAAQTGKYPVIDAILRACSELPKSCPCPLTVCPEAHHKCCKCETTENLVSGPGLPLVLRRTWCQQCRTQTFDVPFEYSKPARMDPESA